jgi:hypothetical protein
MQRYFMHLRNGAGFLPDQEGVLAAGPDEIRRLAIVNIRSLLSEEVLAGKVNLRGQIEVADEGGATIMTVRFDHAVAITAGEAA